MKKAVLVLFLGLATLHLSAQDLKSLTNKAKESVMSSSMISDFASDQVKRLTKKLNLSASVQDQISGLVVNQLKSDKFQKLLGSFGATSFEGVSDEQKEEVTEALMDDVDFKKEMTNLMMEQKEKKLDTSKPSKLLKTTKG